MARIDFQFSGDDSQLKSNDFDRQPLPDGKYMVEVADADYRDNSTGTGSYVMVEFNVIDGEFSGRKLWSNLNIIHANEQAQEIGQQQMAKLCLATLGKPSCTDTDELIGRQLVVGVGLDKKDPSRNRIKWFESVQQTTSAPAARTTAAPSVAKSANPWKK